MSNPLYQEMMGSANTNYPIQILTQLRNNPIQFVLQRGFNLPQNIEANPNAIIQHLLNTGQVSQSQYNSAVQTAQSFSQFR